MTIAEVSKKYNLTQDTIRYYEKLIKYVSLFREGKDTVSERKELLKEQKQKLLIKQKKINDTLERLNYKIKLYDDIESGKRKDFTEEIL